ncbi:MAG TPA: glycosyltransferase family 87 protein [Acidimicrobiales bacterium]|nr:glycosyltransferase family 87 protein [Acidimicrobiales bacterium]
MPPSAPEPRSPPAAPAARWAGAGFVAAAAAGAGLCLSFVTAEPLRNDRWALLARLAVWAVVWGAGVVCALRLPRRYAVPAIVAVAFVLRVAALAGQPILSDDLHRYAWDGRVQVSGTDPYRYPPSSPDLAGLREEWLWPDAEGCAGLQREPGCTRINRPTVRTIYPPVAEAWFTAVYSVAGIDARHKAWQVAGLLGDMALVALLPAVLRAWKRDDRWTALYALSPVAVVEVVNNGHVDGLAALFLVAALLASARRRPAWAGALVGAAFLVKLYPAVAGLAFLAHRGRRGVTRLAAAFVAVVALAYLPHVATVGLRVVGYLPGYLEEERYGEGGRYLLAGLLGLPPAVTAVLAGAGVAAAAGWVLARRVDAPRGSAVLLGALLLAVTPVQPWYAVTLLAVAAVAARPAWSAVAVAGYPYFFAVLLDSPHAVAIGRVSYGLALAVIVGCRLYAPRLTERGEDADRAGAGGRGGDHDGVHGVR